MLQGLILIGLIVAVIRLSQKMAQLHGRIDMLEGLALERSGAQTAEPIEAPADLSPVFREAEAPAMPELIEARTIFAPPPIAEPIELPPEQVFADAQSEVPARASSIGFEELFGRRLPIWAGGITLAIAGALIVRFSIDAGLFPPIVRVLMGMLFGAGLIGGAELAHRRTEWVRDPRVAQALSGAGIAIFYSSIVVAANLYHLVAPLTAFVGLAAVTAAAMALALRFGEPSALLGLVGGLAAPVLVGSGEPNIPLLTAYLGLVVGGLCTVSRRQRWMWLGVGALIGGFGWGGVLIATGALSGMASISVGIYLLLIGLAFPMLASGGARQADLRIVSSMIAALQIAAMIALGGFAMLDWGLFGLLSIGIAWLAHRDTKFARLPALALAIALPLIGYWPNPGVGAFAAVMIGTLLIYGAPAVFGLWRARGGITEAGQIAALGIGAVLLSLWHFHTAGDGRAILFGGLAMACAAFPAAAAALGWRETARRGDARFATLALSAASLVAAAGVLAVPHFLVPTWVAAAGLAMLVLGTIAEDRQIEGGAWALGSVAILLLVGLDTRAFDEIEAATTLQSGHALDAQGVLRWALLAPVLAGFAWMGRHPVGRGIAQAFAVLVAYVAMAQGMPDLAKSLVPAVELLALTLWSRLFAEDRLLAATGSAVGLSVLWAIQPVGEWVAAATASLVAIPIEPAALPNPVRCLSLLLIPGATIATASVVARVRPIARTIAVPIAAPLGVVAIHSLYRHGLASMTSASFAAWGMPERILWEAALLGMAFVAWRQVARHVAMTWIAVGLGMAALTHAGFYSILLHNPLWADQDVGPAPLLNWLLPLYALPMAILLLSRRLFAQETARLDRARSIAQMALILLFGFSELRQIVHGSHLSISGVTGAEDVLRSVVAIGIAIGFLLWGIRRPSQDWRIGSLLVMLAAVGKVFLVDAAALDGLQRIASFVALGFSLIGIGWLYSRYLKADPENAVK